MVVTLDERGRVSLRAIARPEDTQFIAETLDDGRILLTPAVTVSKNQAILHNHPEILEAIDQAHDGRIVRRQRYTKR